MNTFQSMSSGERLQFWKETLDAYHKAERPIKEFCRERQISVSSLLQWKRKLRKLEGQSETVAIPVIKRREPKGAASEIGGGKLHIEVDGMAFQVSGNVDPSWVAALLLSLQGGETC